MLRELPPSLSPPTDAAALDVWLARHGLDLTTGRWWLLEHRRWHRWYVASGAHAQALVYGTPTSTFLYRIMGDVRPPEVKVPAREA
jgi:hypothetical protein